MGPKWTGRSGELRRRKVAPCADCRLGRAGSAVLGTVSLPGWRALQAGPAGASAPPGGARPRGSSRWRRRKRGAAGTDVANCGERLVGVSVGSATKPTCSGRGRLRPARRERSADRGPQGTGLPPSGGWRQRKSFGHDGFGGAQHRRDQRARVEVALAGLMATIGRGRKSAAPGCGHPREREHLGAAAPPWLELDRTYAPLEPASRRFVRRPGAGRPARGPRSPTEAPVHAAAPRTPQAPCSGPGLIPSRTRSLAHCSVPSASSTAWSYSAFETGSLVPVVLNS